jgi:hypothetical protein
MRRRFEDPADSLELTLGCMWDNFGNIILIALLVTILARESKTLEKTSGSPALTQLGAARAEDALALGKSVQADLARQAADPTLAQRLKLVQERENLRQEIERQRESLRLTAEKLAASAAIAKTSIADILRHSQEELEKTQKTLAQEQSRTDTLKLTLETQKKKLQERQRELVVATDQRVRRVRLPREHQTSKKHLYVITRFGRLYPLYYFRDSEPQRNTVSLRWTDESPTIRRVEPAPDQGLAALADPAALARFFHQFPAAEVYLVFQVYEDSFAAFNAAKEAAVAQGLEYTWEPRRSDEVLRTGAAALPPPPQ